MNCDICCNNVHIVFTCKSCENITDYTNCVACSKNCFISLGI